MPGIDDPIFAMRLRKLIRDMVREDTERHRPGPRLAQVMSVDESLGVALVQFAGSSDTITVPFPTSLTTPEVGALARIEGSRGDPLITSWQNAELIEGGIGGTPSQEPGVVDPPDPSPGPGEDPEVEEPPPDPDPDPGELPDTDTPNPGIPAVSMEYGVYKQPETPTSYDAFATFAGDGALGFLKKHSIRQYGGTGASPQTRWQGWSTGPAGGFPGGSYSGRQLVVNLVPFPNDAGASLAQVANGAYAAYYTTLGMSYINAGHDDAIFCYGHEFNFAPIWTAIGHESEYVDAWQWAYDLLTGLPGANFEFAWNPGRGAAQLDPRDCYPGDSYVDYICMNFYDADSQFKHPDHPDGEATLGDMNDARWAKWYGMEWGLNDFMDFANSHSKPMAFPEWGGQHFSVDTSAGTRGYTGGGDNPDFMTLFHDWITDHNVAFHAYHETNNPERHHYLEGGDVPLMAAEFQSLDWTV